MYRCPDRRDTSEWSSHEVLSHLYSSNASGVFLVNNLTWKVQKHSFVQSPVCFIIPHVFRRKNRDFIWSIHNLYRFFTVFRVMFAN